MIKIVGSEFVKSAVKPEHYTYNSYVDVAFVGKSNVGKSSLLNTLTNRKKIAKISSTPGKTKLINFFKIRFKSQTDQEGFLNFVDLPGYGYAKVSKTERESWKKMIALYFKNRIELKSVILLIDIRHKMDSKDATMLQMIKEYKIPYLIAATKSDKIAKSKIAQRIKYFSNEYKVLKDNIIAVSSLNKSGKDNILAWIEKSILH
ncbi:MAG: ribosome biogenesis GTP-binding protein YihA/YsxC [Candidatus Cloacimonetes bacterium]|nr:ribosome biogenesis GTP-binding protein YihA/YsxC [Candidatus Cloacimonadota bacterium]